MENQTKLTKEDIGRIKYAPLAEKYRCSVGYVRMVLLGERERNTVRSRKVLKDALDMIEILNRETTITA
jgi:hypothetical protein